MSTVWFGPTSALVCMIYCLNSPCFNVVRNPGRSPIDSPARAGDRQWIMVFNVNAFLTPAPVTITPRLAPVMNLSGGLWCLVTSPYHNCSYPVIPFPAASSRRQQMMLLLSGRQRLPVCLKLYNRSTSTNLAALAHRMRGGFQFSP
jgi:hypothetical protein